MYCDYEKNVVHLFFGSFFFCRKSVFAYILEEGEMLGSVYQQVLKHKP